VVLAASSQVTRTIKLGKRLGYGVGCLAGLVPPSPAAGEVLHPRASRRHPRSHPPHLGEYNFAGHISKSPAGKGLDHSTIEAEERGA